MVTMVLSQTPNPSSSSVDPRLQKAAQEFEAMLLADLMKIGASDEPGDGELDQSCQGYEDLRIQAVTSALAKNGGIGIGKLLIDRLNAEGRH